MSEPMLLQTLFNQQRLQVLHLAKNHGEFYPAYIYAWQYGVYPLLQDSDGSVPQRVHETYADLFITPKATVQEILNVLSKIALGDDIPYLNELTTRELSGYCESDISSVCRYLYLDGCWDEQFWSQLLNPMQRSSIRDGIDFIYSPEEIDLY